MAKARFLAYLWMAVAVIGAVTGGLLEVMGALILSKLWWDTAERKER